jgi:hypothetical protein
MTQIAAEKNNLWSRRKHKQRLSHREAFVREAAAFGLSITEQKVGELKWHSYGSVEVR